MVKVAVITKVIIKGSIKNLHYQLLITTKTGLGSTKYFGKIVITVTVKEQELAGKRMPAVSYFHWY